VNIDLIKFGEQKVSWNAGSIFDCTYDVPSINLLLKKLLTISPEGHILFFDTKLGPINPQRVASLINSENEIITGIETNFPELLSYSVPSSYFNLRPPNNVNGYTSWFISLRCCLIDKKLLTEKFLDERFLSIQGATIHWGFQQLYAGAIIRHTSAFGISSENGEDVVYKDQMRLIKYNQGFAWAGWTCFRLAATKFSSSISLLFYLLEIGKNRSNAVKQVKWTDWRSARYNTDAKVTILIPTVDRYSYLVTLLQQLLTQTILPYEVIVIDQTVPERRQLLTRNDYHLIGLKLIYQEISGQCSSRNEGLQVCTGDFILFLDDDDEVKPDLIEQHLKCLSYFQADVSCGVCDEVGAGSIPKEYNLIRMSDVFPTNNGMVRRKVLYSTGLFDLTYNRGQKADGDLGARIYKAGALMILNPEIRVLHHRAPSGGLRKHNVRKVTYASSRAKITHFRLPHITELYFNRKHFTKLQQTEYIWLSLLGTFSIRGNWILKMLKFGWALLNLPLNVFKIRMRDSKAVLLIESSPLTPVLSNKW